MNREQETEEILTDAGAAAQDGGDCPEQETETAEKMPEESENAGTEAAEEEGRKGLFTKKKKKDKKDEQIEDLTDRLKRQMAEFENFRKRTEKEKSQMFDLGAKNIIEKVLPVIDNFERGLAAVPDEEKENPFADREFLRCGYSVRPWSAGFRRGWAWAGRAQYLRHCREVWRYL